VTKLTRAWNLFYNAMGDKRTKNLLLVILTLMSAFGIVAPDTATSLRNSILSMVL
jgi:hypothetical protein